MHLHCLVLGTTLVASGSHRTVVITKKFLNSYCLRAQQEVTKQSVVGLSVKEADKLMFIAVA